MSARCKVCGRRTCELPEHRDRFVCKACGNPMREPVPDGLCGLCKEEAEIARQAA